MHLETACTPSIPATCQYQSSITFTDLAIRYHQDDCIDLENSSPPGFVYIPQGSVSYGGDPEAYQGLPRGEEVLKGFFIGRFEVTVGEYLEFINDEEVRDRIDPKSIDTLQKLASRTIQFCHPAAGPCQCDRGAEYSARRGRASRLRSTTPASKNRGGSN